MGEEEPRQAPSKSILTEEKKETLRSYMQLLMYMVLEASYGFNVLYIQPIARSMKEGFDKTDNELSILLTLGSISSFLCFLPLIYIVVMKGLRAGVLVGLFMLTAGTFCELFIKQSWSLIYVGHFIAHLGSPVFNIANAKFCSVWFGPKMRPLALTINAMMSSVGLMMAFIIPGLFVKSDNSQTKEVIQTNVGYFHYFLMGLYGGMFVICFFFFKEAPDNYKTYEIEEKNIRANFKMFTQMWELLREPTYICFVFVLGIGVTSIVINQLLIVQMMNPFDISQENCQLGGAIIVFSGVVGSVTYSKTLIHLPNQLRKLKILYMIVLIVYTLYSYLPSTKSLTAFYLGCSILGLFGMTQISIIVESLVKYIVLTGPQRLVIGTGVGQAVLSMCSGFFAFAVKGFLAEQSVEGVYKINIFVMGAIMVTFVLAVCLQIGFETRINKILRAANKAKKALELLPQADLQDDERDRLMSSLATEAVVKSRNNTNHLSRQENA